MEEPLLLRSNKAQTPPPRHVFQIRSRTETEEADSAEALALRARSERLRNALFPAPRRSGEIDLSHEGNFDDNGDTSSPSMEEGQCLNEELSLLHGKAYGRESSFWCVNLPSAIVVGILVGGLSVGFVGVTEAMTSLWIPCQGDIKNDCKDTHIYWIGLVAVLGSLATGIIFFLVDWWFGRRSTEGQAFVDSIFYSASSLWMTQELFETESNHDGHLRHFVFVIFAGFVALISGAPVGPEFVVGAIATAFGKLVAAVVPLMMHHAPGHGLLYHDGSSPINMIRIALAASIVPFIPSPVVGPVVAGELAQLVGIPPTWEEVEHTHDECKTWPGHDRLEQFSLQLAASLASSLCARAILSVVHWKLAVFVEKNDDMGHYQYHHGHVLVAALIGILGGCLALMGNATMTFSRWLRRSCCRQISMSCGTMGYWIVPLAFPILAALCNMGIFVVAPEVAGSGLSFIQTTITSLRTNHTSISDPEEYVDSSDENHRFWFLLIALVKIMGVSISTSFGLVGGSLTPLLFSGCCLGHSLENVMGAVPPLVTYSCAIVAMSFTAFPFPVSTVLVSLAWFGGSFDLLVPITVSFLVSWLVVGGMGLPLTLANVSISDGVLRRLESLTGHNEDEEEGEEQDQEPEELSQQPTKCRRSPPKYPISYFWWLEKVDVWDLSTVRADGKRWHITLKCAFDLLLAERGMPVDLCG